MSKFKRFIAWLFNIQPEDLPQQPGIQKQTDQAVPYTREEINLLIRQQVSEELDNRKEASLTQEEPVIIPPPTVKKIQEPSELVIAQPEQAITDQLDEEFPVLEEEVLPVQESEPPAPVSEEPITSFTEVLPVEEEILPITEEEPVPLPAVETQPPVLASIEGKQIRLGIDFGTTTTAVSIKFGDDLPIALPIGQDGTTTYIPSVVYFAPGPEPLEHRATIGEEAESYNDPSRTIRSVKRCFGCKGGACKSERRQSYCRGNGAIQLEGEGSIKPSFIARLIVKEALRRSIHYVRDRWQIDLSQANVCILPVNFGCGAKFDLIQRNVICEIAADLGFTDFSIQNVVEEPILAGFAFSRFAKNPIGRSLIYDFGGGTFDAAIIEVDEEGQDRRVTILATSADNWLGGDDIDTVIYQYFLKQIASSLPDQPPQMIESSLNANDAGRIRQRAKEAKEYLSVNDTYDVTFPLSPLGLLDLRLDQATFESLLTESKLIKKSLGVVHHACQLVYVYDEACKADSVDSQNVIGLTPSQASAMIDHVVLVGGVTKIPYVRRRLVEIFGEDKIIQETVIEPVSAVAVGGAYAHDPGHYSIVVPPFGFYLTYQKHGKLVKDYLARPYDYYDFNQYWATAAVGSFKIPVKVLEDRPNAKLYMGRVGEKEAKLIKSWSVLKMGDWDLSISLDGTIGFQRRGEGIDNLTMDIPKHPRQQAIVDARKARDEAKRREADKGWSFDDDMRSMRVDP